MWYVTNSITRFLLAQDSLIAPLCYLNPRSLLQITSRSAWIGFTYQCDIDRIESFLRKCVCFNLAPPDQVLFCVLVESHEEKLFNAIVSNPEHVLYSLLSTKKENTYNMRKRVHNFVIPERKSKLGDSNFILRIIHKTLFSATPSWFEQP